jgi:hypothetical protein
VGLSAPWGGRSRWVLARNGIRLLPRPRDYRARQVLWDSRHLWVRSRHQMQRPLNPGFLLLAPQIRTEFAHSISLSIRLNASARRVSST